MKKQLLTLSLALASLFAMAQDQKQTFTRKILIEQFTTAQCGYCPAGADRIHDAIDGTNNVIWIKHHAGFGTDGLTNNIHETMLCFYGGNTFAPAMMIDRTRFDASDAGPVASVGNVSAIRALVAQAKAETTYCKVLTPSVNYNRATHHLTGTVSGRFGEQVWDENTRLCVFLIEDSIFMQQHDYYNGVSSNQYAVDYWHMGTIRSAITNMWGDPITVDESDMSFSYNIDFTLPQEYEYRNCKVVAFVFNYDASNINNCKVMNAAESAYLGETTEGIGETASACALRLFPNPASDRVVLESDAAINQVTVLNTLGQVVAHYNGNATQHFDLSVAQYTPGLYLVRIQTAQGIATRQLIVK